MHLANIYIENCEKDEKMAVVADHEEYTFREFFTLCNGKPYVERRDSNLLINCQDELKQAFGEGWKEKLALLHEEFETRLSDIWKGIYIEAYDKEISRLVPAFDVEKDKEENDSPWSYRGLDKIVAKSFDSLKRWAVEDAQEDALEIAQEIMDRIEQEEDKDILILLDDDETYKLLTYDECFAKFANHEDGPFTDVQIEEAFYRAMNGMSAEIFRDLILAVKGDCADYFTRAYKITLDLFFNMQDIEELMIDEIYKKLHCKLLPCSDLLFLTHYLKEHWEHCGSVFRWR